MKILIVITGFRDVGQFHPDCFFVVYHTGLLAIVQRLDVDLLVAVSRRLCHPYLELFR